MAEHYFSARPVAQHRTAEFRVEVRGIALRLATDAAVFSRDRLDRGTELLLEAFEPGPCELVLDLGCGYGPLGLVAAKLAPDAHVILTDVNERAVRLAEANREANGVGNAEVRHGDLYAPVADLAFDHILCNPPIRAGRRVTDRIVSEAPAHLLDGGSLWLVVRTKQGASSMRERMRAAFGEAHIAKRGSGYKVLRARKRGGGP